MTYKCAGYTTVSNRLRFTIPDQLTGGTQLASVVVFLALFEGLSAGGRGRGKRGGRVREGEERIVMILYTLDK
jgi:hypothetical protein